MKWIWWNEFNEIKLNEIFLLILLKIIKFTSKKTLFDKFDSIMLNLIKIEMFL